MHSAAGRVIIRDILMRIQMLVPILLLSLVFSTPALAADCANGRGELQKSLWDGYSLHIAPAQSQPNQCQATVTAPDGKTIFELTGVDASMLRISGRDVNGDGKPDLVLLSHTASSPENVYSVVGTAEPAGLIRQIVTSAELSFEPRGEEGRMEIVARDTAFRDFEGLPPEQAPKPLLFLRLKGKDIYNVSYVYWPEYEREITIAKSKLSKKDITDFTDDRGALPREGQQRDLTPEQVEHLQETKALVLEIALDYIYGGKGQDAWKTISDMWPLADRQRIRQEILRVRATGVMRDINRPAPKQASAQ